MSQSKGTDSRIIGLLEKADEDLIKKTDSKMIIFRFGSSKNDKGEWVRDLKKQCKIQLFEYGKQMDLFPIDIAAILKLVDENREVYDIGLEIYATELSKKQIDVKDLLPKK